MLGIPILVVSSPVYKLVGDFHIGHIDMALIHFRGNLIHGEVFQTVHDPYNDRIPNWNIKRLQKASDYFTISLYKSFKKAVL